MTVGETRGRFSGPGCGQMFAGRPETFFEGNVTRKFGENPCVYGRPRAYLRDFCKIYAQATVFVLTDSYLRNMLNVIAYW
jgi:hypothetical protein